MLVRHALTALSAATCLLWSAAALGQQPEAQPQAAPKPAMPELEGVWVQLNVTTAITKLPVISDVTSTTRSLVLVEVLQDGERLLMSEEVCTLTMDSEPKRIQTSFSPGYIKAVSGVRRSARLWREGDSYQFEAPRNTLVYGAKLANPGRDKLPTDPDDKRVVDADRDGKPGITVQLRGTIDGEVYTVQRSVNSLRGKLTSPDLIEGTITWTSQSTVLDATSMFLKSTPDTQPDKRASKNFFKLRRMPAGTTCATVRAQAKALFP